MTKIPVFYTPRMVADSESASPSALKPAAVVESWRLEFEEVMEIIEPAPATLDELREAHATEFVRSILACERSNGFGNKSKAVAATLPYTSGAMLSAARYALQSGDVAVAPCSGFHHAGFERAEGFCTFNGLMITAFALRKDGARRIGILDLDMHYGNGTDNIIQAQQHQYRCKDWIRHFTGGATYTNRNQAPEFFSERLPAVLTSMSDCDIVLYQAGADPHIEDPYGGWLTTDELRKRDAMVFEALHEHSVPVAWNLAGGYQVEEDGSIPKVLEIHDNTMRECVRVFGDSR